MRRKQYLPAPSFLATASTETQERVFTVVTSRNSAARTHVVGRSNGASRSNYK